MAISASSRFTEIYYPGFDESTIVISGNAEAGCAKHIWKRNIVQTASALRVSSTFHNISFQNTNNNLVGALSRNDNYCRLHQTRSNIFP